MATTPHTSATTTDASRPVTDASSAEGVERFWRALTAATAGLVASGLMIALAWNQGGYFPEHHLPAGAVAFATLAVLVALRPPHWQISTPAYVALGALCGLAVWTGLSSHWSSAPDTALEDFQRTLVYIGIFGLGLMAAGSGRYSRHLLWAVLVVVVVVVGAGLISRLYPEWISPVSTRNRFAGYRLNYPLSYWNAFGAFGAVGVVLAAGLAADLRSHVVLRALAAGLTVPLGVAAYLSFSRGSWVAFLAGIVVLVVMARRPAALLVTLAICGVACATAIGRLTAYPALTDQPFAGAGVVEEGAAFGPFLLFVALVTAVAQVMASGHWLPAETRARLRRASRPLVLAGVVVVVLAGAGFYVLRAGDVEGGSAARIERVQKWLDREWDEFMTPAGFSQSGPERLKTARGSRSDHYRVAIDGFEAHPLWGDGAGGYEYRYAHDRKTAVKVRDAHSLYLETAGELGLVGVLLLLGFIGAVVWAAVGARRKGGALSGGQSAAAAAAFTVWMVSAGLDWDWQIPTLTGTAVLLAAAVFPEGRGRRPPRRDQTPRWGHGRASTGRQ